VSSPTESIWMRPERPARGPRPAYTRAQIVAAAIGMADTEGIEAVSMRRVAAAVGAGTMSLYRYVPRKEDLVELMVDTVSGEIELPDRPSGNWRDDLGLLAHQTRGVERRHPWMLQFAEGVPIFGPNRMKLMEFAGAVLDGIGLDIDEIMFMAGLLTGYVANFVRDEVAWELELKRTGRTMEDWRMANESWVTKIMESGEYPMMTRIVRDARTPHMDRDERFQYGLDLILDVIAGGLPG
jgi:AcrR family transcriptional regulator